MNDTNICGWTGVGCNSAGMVTSLSMSAPGIPVRFPDEFGLLGSQVNSIQVIGDGFYPGKRYLI